jgi:AcrR family transcriptional regulator
MKIRVRRKSPQAYQHGDLREALIQAGLKLLTEGGVETLSLRAAAQLAGVSHAAPYRHFRDKNALVAAIAERGFRLLTAAMQAEAALAKPRDSRERLTALGIGYLHFATQNPGYLRVIFGGVLCGDDPPADLRAAGEAAYGTLREAIVDGIAQGELRTADPDQLALASWSMVHGLSTLLINRAFEPQVAERELATGVLHLLGDGIYAERGRP